MPKGPVSKTRKLALIRKLNAITALALDMCGAYGADTKEMRAKVRAAHKELKANLV